MSTKTVALLFSIAAFIGFLAFYAEDAGNLTYENEEVSDLECGFTTHFSNFLQNKGYSSYGVDRSDLKCGAFGGK